MIFNPVIVGGGTKLPELTNPGTAADLLAPKQLIDAEGNALTGTITTNSASDLTASGATVTAPAGYYPSAASKSVATATQATPTISVSSAGLITASATQTAGYVSAGTKSATKQLTTKAAVTYTPSTTNQTIASGTYLTGTQTIKGDANLLAANIKSGVSIFGVAGTLSSGGMQIEVGTYAGTCKYGASTQTSQSIPVAFTPKFVWIAILRPTSRTNGYTPFASWIDYDDTQSPKTQGRHYQWNLWAYTGNPWCSPSDSGAVDNLTITETGFDIINSIYKYVSADGTQEQTYYVAPNALTYDYIYLAIG